MDNLPLRVHSSQILLIACELFVFPGFFTEEKFFVPLFVAMEML